MVYRVGDRIIIKSLEWYDKNKSTSGVVYVPLTFNRNMKEYCGKLATITDVIHSISSIFYKIDLDDRVWNWTEEMFDCIRVIRKYKLEKLETVSKCHNQL